MKSKEQELIDIIFQIGLTTKENKTLKKMDRETYCTWIRKKLEGCGYYTIPLGASWGVLVEKPDDYPCLNCLWPECDECTKLTEYRIKNGYVY